MSVTRRKFLGEASCATIGSVSVLSSLLNLKLANQAAAANLPSGSDTKSIVCILMSGGCDTFNVLLRRDGDENSGGYGAYKGSRSNLALAQNTLVSLNRTGGETGSERFAVHPSCGLLADMFNGTGDFNGKRRLSFVSNLGTLIQPTTKSDITMNKPGLKLPKSLFSHIDQITQWQTSIPQGEAQATGWAGRMADVLCDDQDTNEFSMSISLAGNNTFQIGNSTSQFAITGSGALLPSGNNPGLGNETARKNFAAQNLIEANYNNLIQQAYADHNKKSVDVQRAFKVIYDAVDIPANLVSKFPNTKFGSEMLAAAKTLIARRSLGLRRSTIFVERPNWDHHGELLMAHQAMLTELSQAISAYQQVLEHPNFAIQDEVITYTASDFGRTLRSNGRGTDHAWGGNQMVFGGPVTGGEVLGTFPNLELNSIDDIGLGGRILPTTSIDEFFAEMAIWFGISNSDLHDKVLPNLSNFVPNIALNPKPIGFLA